METSKEMNEIKEVERQITQVDVKVSNILVLLKGNELDNSDRGMIGDIKDFEKRLTRLEVMKDRATWFFIGISIPAGWGIIDIIQSIILRKP